MDAAQRHSLNITDLLQVLEVLRKYKFPNEKCDDLCLVLGLTPETLETIKAKNDKTHDVLLVGLSAWLHNADSNDDPTWDVLIDAIRSTKEDIIANAIYAEKVMPVYDGTDLDVSNEGHAINIFRRHRSHLLQMKDPFAVAKNLKKKGLSISDETMQNMCAYERSMCGKAVLLLVEVKKGLAKDYRNLQVLADVCQETGNAVLIQGLLKDYTTTFSNEAIVTRGAFKRELSIMNPARVAHEKLFAFIQQRYFVQLACPSKISQCIAFVGEDCTLFDATQLRSLIQEFNDPDRQVQKLTKARSRIPIQKMETLVTTIECSSSKNTPEMKQQLLHELFGNIHCDVVEIDHSDTGAMICAFNPLNAQLVMTSIIDQYEVLAEKGIMNITVGYCPVLDETIYQKMHDELKSQVDQLTEKLEDLQSKHSEQLEKAKTVQEEVASKVDTEKALSRKRMLENEVLLSTVTGLKEVLVEKEGEIKSLKGNIITLVSEKKEKEKEIKELEKALALSQMQIQELQDNPEQTRQQSGIHQMQSLPTSDSEVKKLRENLLVEERKVKELDEKVRELQIENEELKLNGEYYKAQAVELKERMRHFTRIWVFGTTIYFNIKW